MASWCSFGIHESFLSQQQLTCSEKKLNNNFYEKVCDFSPWMLATKVFSEHTWELVVALASRRELEKVLPEYFFLVGMPILSCLCGSALYPQTASNVGDVLGDSSMAPLESSEIIIASIDEKPAEPADIAVPTGKGVTPLTPNLIDFEKESGGKSPLLYLWHAV